MISKVEATYMTLNRIIHGGWTFRTNKTKICNEIEVDLPKQNLYKTAVKFLHKHLTTRKCESILNQMIIPKRKVSTIYMKQPQLGQYHGALDKIVEVYNKLPPQVRCMKIGAFKKYLSRNPIKIT